LQNNAGDGTINAYSLSGVLQGQIMLGSSPFSEKELWAITFGNGGSAGAANILYFSAGYTADAANGLIGAISVPEPGTMVLGLLAVGLLAGGRRSGNGRRAPRSSPLPHNFAAITGK